ncbi:MAG TPA: hypothetical protein VMZ28_23350 [Kofleriaceae bacterium]|nr:hypothetical protein [Kofleriaceae bacterium]
MLEQLTRAASPERFRRRQRNLLAAVVALWLVVCVGGIGLLLAYKARPGSAGEPPGSWPDAAAALARDPQRPTLVMLIHPRCPCTRASLAELNVVLNRARGAATAYLLFSVPVEAREGWEAGESWDRAGEIPGVTRVVDRGGRLAAAFGVDVSGHTLLYDRSGRLRFSGGVTGARGHEGDNLGEARLAAALAGDAREETSAVFGCELVKPE